MVIGTDGKWSKALKAAFIQAPAAGRVKMPPPPGLPALNQRAAAAVSGGAAPGPRGGPGAALERTASLLTLK
jgi:hypothetical protein